MKKYTGNGSSNYERGDTGGSHGDYEHGVAKMARKPRAPGIAPRSQAQQAKRTVRGATRHIKPSDGDRGDSYGVDHPKSPFSGGPRHK